MATLRAADPVVVRPRSSEDVALNGNAYVRYRHHSLSRAGLGAA